jgi:hypothetical protein
MRSTLRIRIITWLATRDCADAVVVLSAHVRTNGHVQGAYFHPTADRTKVSAE